MTDRSDLDKKLAEMGYEHPSDPVQNLSAYQTYNGYGYVTQKQTVYKTFNTENKIGESVQRNDICPTCDKKAVSICNCEFSDMMCPDEHIWRITKEGKVIMGDPHE